MSLIDPKRVNTILDVLNRYSSILAPGDRILRGMEGDPLFDSTKPRQTYTVLEIDRSDNGQVTFKAVEEESGTIETFNNIEMSPDKTWELDPDLVDEIKQTYKGTDFDARVRALEEKINALSREFEEAQTSHREYRSTVADTFKQITDDLRYGSTDFSTMYSEKYKNTANTLKYEEDAISDVENS